ncbi:hypothetical protein F3Y22_tig00117017pilonHSYRG00447 [Hibiscus syriacus]|uniref:DUF4216 domain-containing protein n=1 Tax=Hibiscus syriacus TaxID=106335 RepID=A0A6A2XPK8_HIBSY|nr:hypothetical protein F3Y22_tig00117017pilonHSYRG00447 [Hibiscus syriacus]
MLCTQRKNVCESVYGTLLNLPGKMKDGLGEREDIEAMGIKPELQTQPRGNRTWLPPTCYTLNTTEKHRFYETMSTIKVPDGYCSNFKNLVSDDVSKMNGLKSNDCHVLMQQLLPFAIKGVLHVKVRKIIIECYVAEEALEFCSDYLKILKSIGNPHERVNERVRTGKPLSRGTIEVVNAKLLDEAHLYVLRNTANVEPYIDGVSLVAHARQIASAKDSNPVYGAITYYGHDFGFTVVNFARLDHQSERFILASQAKHVFYVQDQQDVNLSVVGFTPHKMHKYGANGETDDMLEYHSSSHDEDSKQRGPTIKGKITEGKVIVTYNKKGVLIGVEATKLASFEGMVARSMVPITYATWQDVEQEKKEDLWQYILMNFELDPRSRKNTLQSIGTKWTNFKHYLYKKFIEKFKNNPNANLLNPPEMYLYLKIDEWKVFLSQRLSKKWEEISQKAKKMHGKHRYNHRLSRKGYAGLTLEIMQEMGKEVDEIDRALLWKKVRQMKKGGYDPNVQIVVDKMEEMQKAETLGEVSCGTNDMLTQALGENIEVMMEMSVQGDALLPFPLDEEFIYKVKDAVGFLVKWPRHLVIRCSDLSVKVQCEDDMFGYESFTYITWEDFEVVFTVDEMTGSAITCYMMEMNLYNAQSGSNKKVSLNWLNVLCPRQSGGTECGYYVCKFMKEIFENELQVMVNKNVGDGKEEYTDDDIDDIHKEWVSYVANFIMP